MDETSITFVVGFGTLTLLARGLLMRQNRASGKAFGAVSLLTALILGLVLTARTQAQSPQILGDILTTPQNYWNKTVVVKGHVVGVTPNSPGAKQGSYL